MSARSAPVTILFTDLVNSTELLQRAGDEAAQHVFDAHRDLLRAAITAHDGAEVKWLGDGLMVAFQSAADAVRCAIEMQRSARQRVQGERLLVRIGVNAGEVMQSDRDYFGTPVVVARRLCDRASAGQIVCSSLVPALLSGRSEFEFNPLGDLSLKGIAAPVSACEVVYRVDRLATFRAAPPFVGRIGEMAKLDEKLKQLRLGGGIVMVVGEPGMGKTRIMEEFAGRARSDGAVVLWGRCYEGEWAPSFIPFIEAINAYAQTVEPGRLVEDLGYAAATIARVVPDLHGVLGNLPEPPALQPEEERFRLLEAVADFLVAAARRWPIVLMLDDLQWADRGTIAMLRHVARALSASRVLVVGAYRNIDLDRTHPLSDALGALRREAPYERILLKGLDAGQVGELLGSIVDEDVPAELASVIGVETDGNPFFIREILVHLAEEGKLLGEDGALLSGSIADMGIPEGVREVIGRRVSHLSHGCGRLLTLASTMTGGCPWEVLLAISGEDEATVLDHLDEALAAHLMRERKSDGALTYDFAHALIRQTLYEELSAPRRLVLHRRIGEALETLYADDLESHVAELAHHFLQASHGADVSKGVDYAARAGRRAMARAAYEEAAGLYERGLQVLAAHAPSRREQTCELLLALGDAQMFGGEPDTAMKSFVEAAELARQLPTRDAFARAAFGYDTARFTAGPSLLRAERQFAEKLLREALDGLTGETALRARVLARLASCVAWNQDDARADLTAEALRIARAAGDPETTVYTLYARLSLTPAGPHTVHERLESASDVVSAAEATADKEHALLGRYLRMHALLELGRIADADAEMEAFAALADELRIPQYRAWTLFFRSMRAFMAGRFDEADQLSQEALAMDRRLQTSVAVSLFGVQTFTSRRERGQLESLEGAVTGFVERYPEIRWLCALADLHVEIGKQADARRELDQLAEHDFTDLQRDGNWLIALTLLSEVCFALARHAARRAALRPDAPLCRPQRRRRARAGLRGVGIAAISRFSRRRCPTGKERCVMRRSRSP